MMAAVLLAPAPPAKAGRGDPRNDPRFRAVVDKLGADSKRLKQHPPARSKAEQPYRAAKAPPDEKAAGARAKQVDKLQAAETPKPETASFLSILQAEIAKVMPKTLGDTEKFMQGGSGGAIKQSLQGNVQQQKAEATGALKQTSSEAPSEAGVPAKPVTSIPPEPAAAAPQVDAAAAMPAPKSAQEISLQGSKGEVAADLAERKIDDAQLRKGQGDARYSAVLGARAAVGQQADAGPARYRAAEVGVLAKAASAAVGVARKGVVLLLGTRAGSKTKVLSKQEQQKAREEQELKTFTSFLKATFESTQAAVQRRLDALEERVNALFDRGVDTALGNLKSYVEDALRQYKLRRYLLQPGGSLLWIRDQVLDLPAEVSRFYEAGRSRFTAELNGLALRVATLVETQLAAAKTDVKRAQTVIAAKQAALSPAVRGRAAEAAAEYTAKFDELKQGIEDRKQQLAEGLAQKYSEALTKADETLKTIQDENKGLVTQAREKIAELAKALAEFRDRIMGILRKGADTIDLIVKDPIGFLGNLLAAIKAGFNQFAGNIWTHLKAGFVKWLFGALAGAGITIPSDLSITSILKLVLDVLGITYDKMRAKAVKLLGPTAVTVIEKLADYLKTLIGGGPAALWAQIKGDLTNLKEMVIDAIQNWIVTTIVKRAVAKVVSMFNPAGAIVQAILTIYNVVMFVVERAAQIMEFVESVINAVHAIATGAIGGAAARIEKALGNMVPILIGFLAALIGLGGIGQKIREFIMKVQAKVDAAIDKLLKRVVAAVKKLVGAVKAGAKALLQWWKKKSPFTGGGESHALLFEGEKDNARLMVRSTPKTPEDFVKEFAPSDASGPEAKEIHGLAKQIGKLTKDVSKAQAKQPPDEAAILSADAELTAAMNKLGAVLAKLLDKSADEGSEKRPVPVAYPKRRAAAYPNIYIGPLTDLHLPQSWLQSVAALGDGAKSKQALAKFEPKLRTEAGFRSWTGQVRVFKASVAGQAIPGGPVGLAPAFAGLAPGKVLVYSDSGKTGGGSKINNVFRPYGFRPGKEGMDGDHVMERQLGGPDDLSNLWPLPAGENRGSGATVKSMKVQFASKTLTVHEARQTLKKKKKGALHLLIKSTTG